MPFRTLGFALVVTIGMLPDAAGACTIPPLEAQGRFLGGQIYQENDSLIVGDDRYTQGLRLSLQEATPPSWFEGLCNRLAGKLWGQTTSVLPTLSWTIGQHMYTPEIITARDPYPGDRRFGGVLYAGVQAHFAGSDQRFRHTFEALAGLTGSPSLAGAAQSDLHVIRLRRIPKGWHQAPERFVANLNHRFEVRRAACSGSDVCFADVTVGSLFALGNLQTAAGLHGAIRIGYGLTGFPQAAITNAAAAERTPFEIGFIAGWEGRAVAYNGLLEPSQGSFERRGFVDDRRVGVSVRVRAVRLTAMGVERSPEFRVNGREADSQRFASLSLAYEPLGEDEGSRGSWAYRDWRFELGLGHALGPRLESGGRRGGPAGRIGFAKGLAGDFSAGFELGGVAVEDPSRRTGAVHSDVFVVHRAVTLGWTPPLAGRRLRLAAGPTLFGQIAKRETTDNSLLDRRPQEIRESAYERGSRWGWIASAQYSHPLQKHLALALGATHGHPRFETPLEGVRDASFFTSTLAIEIRP